jgi:small subunit ribosomal protein S2
MAKKIEDLVKLNAHIGHTKQNYDPRAKRFIAARVNRVDYLDISALPDHISTMRGFVAKLVEDGGTVLLVGTKRQARSVVQRAATDMNSPYVNTRWVGGTLTNFGTIRAIVNQYERLLARQKTGALDKLPRKEYLINMKEIDRLKKRFDGLRKLRDLPKAVFIIDPVYEENALSEANKLKIPVIATVDSNTNPEKITYPLPINDDSRGAIEYIVSELVGAAKEGITKLSRSKNQVSKT